MNHFMEDMKGRWFAVVISIASLALLLYGVFK